MRKIALLLSALIFCAVPFSQALAVSADCQKGNSLRSTSLVQRNADLQLRNQLPIKLISNVICVSGKQ